METNDRLPRSNPFSTRYVRPGALPYLFCDESTAESVVGRLAVLGGRAQILGPHGSGKSTLLAALIEPLASAGRPAVVWTLHEGQRCLPRDWQADAIEQQARTVIVDGCEQLWPWHRAQLKRQCARRGWWLLITTHRDLGLPTLYVTQTSPELARRVTRSLLPPGQGAITDEMVDDCYRAAGGNLRETLFALYDRFELAGKPTRT